MSNVLIPALVALAVLSIVLAIFVYLLRKEMSRERQRYESEIEYLVDACQQAQLFQSEIGHVLQHCTGGIVKRLNESSQIAHSILANEPGLLIKDSSLLYCLHANDQFLERLYTVARDCTEIEPSQQVDKARASIFFDAYKSAGLPAPPQSIQFHHNQLSTES